MIAQPRRRERDELAQRPERNHAKEHDRRHLVNQNAAASTQHIIHQARMRWLNDCTTAGFSPLSGERFSN